MLVLRCVCFIIFLTKANVVFGDDIFSHEGWTSLRQTPYDMKCMKVDPILCLSGKTSIEDEEFPWMAKIIRLKKIGQFEYLKFHCTGSLINNRFVVTSASCLEEQEMEIKHIELGSSKLSQFMKSGLLIHKMYKYDPMRDYFPEKIIEHPHYFQNPVEYDFGLIKLHKAVTFTELIYPICLPRKDKPDFLTRFTATGWEDNKELENVSSYEMKTDIPEPLRKISVITTDIEDCGVRQHLESTNENILCISDGENKTCHLSGGAPLVGIEEFQGQNYYFLYGVATKFQDGEHCNLRRFYTNTFKYLSFIVDTIVDNTKRMDCGKIKPSKHSLEASRKEFPWMAKLIRVDVQDTQRTLFFHCIGTLVTNQFVVTTASCLQDITLSHIELGTSDLEQPLKIGQDQLLYGFDYTIVSFDTKIMTYSEPGNDLGLIKLLKTVTFTDDIRPICLHKEYESELESFTAFTAAGWEFGDLDKPSQLKKRKVWIINTNVCEKLYSDTAVNSNTLCTEDSESSACHLEGGSPLMKIDEVNGEDYYFLYGMARKLEDIQNCFTPRLYTNMYSVANMANWMFELNFNNSKTN